MERGTNLKKKEELVFLPAPFEKSVGLLLAGVVDAGLAHRADIAANAAVLRIELDVAAGVGAPRLKAGVTPANALNTEAAIGVVGSTAGVTALGAVELVGEQVDALADAQREPGPTAHVHRHGDGIRLCRGVGHRDSIRLGEGITLLLVRRGVLGLEPGHLETTPRSQHYSQNQVSAHVVTLLVGKFSNNPSYHILAFLSIVPWL